MKKSKRRNKNLKIIAKIRKISEKSAKKAENIAKTRKNI